MNTKTRLLILALTAVIINISKVEAQKANYTTRQGMTIGFGVGGAYQQSDIANSIGVGYDFTLGSQLYKREGAFLSADWKFRFLAGENAAYDHRINTDSSYSNLNYRFFNYDLELGLSLNRLRERTRIVVTGFAGAGITHGRSFTDLLDENFAPYDFRSIDPNQDQKQIYADLMALSDNDFETRVNNKAALLPTVGIFIGYQFSPSFSMGIEHKTNFSLSEQNGLTGINIDNKILDGSGMDKNHYTTLGFKWNLGRRSYSSNYIPRESPITYTPEVIQPSNANPTVSNPVVSVSETPPTVKIIDPATNPYKSSSNFISIKARVQNAEGYNQIVFYQDGLEKTNFTYNSYTNIFAIGVNLHSGDNSFRIVATNSAGTAQDRLIVIHEKTNALIYPPEVNFTSPAEQVHHSNTDRMDILAQAKFVSNKEELMLILNGRNIPFDFQPGTGIVRALINLNEGSNSLEITASNRTGTSKDRMEIIFSRPVQEFIPPPSVRIINPPTSIIVSENVFPFRAQTSNIHSRNEITILINGIRYDNFNFSNTGELSLNLSLKEGLNNIEIIGRNESGQRSANTTITYNIPVRINPPSIHIQTPSNNPYSTSESSIDIKVFISNVKGRENISLQINNAFTNNFNFNSNSGELTIGFDLRQGQNIVKISAENEAGKDFKSLSIIREIRQCPLPEISLPDFGREMPTTENKNYNFRAEIKNISNKNQLKLLVNRIEVPFSFNGFTLNYMASLQKGINSFELTARNECGSDSKSVSVSLEEPCQAPVIGFSLIPANRADANHDLRGSITNVTSKSNISVTVNGRAEQGFQFNPGTGQLSGSFKFSSG
ncbi:MAG: hypothetical protein K9H12_05170, partial [Bacteroidales bacterium]|nr:hypothetical protein [Bacteroidales bacterium]